MIDLKEHLTEISGNDYIDANLFKKFSVKRGLRNEDGTGVLSVLQGLETYMVIL